MFVCLYATDRHKKVIEKIRYTIIYAKIKSGQCLYKFASKLLLKNFLIFLPMSQIWSDSEAQIDAVKVGQTTGQGISMG